MILQFDHVTFSYGTTPSLRDLTFDIREGEIVLLAGHNGAGKSTLLKLLNGILHPSSGSVQILGLDTRDHSTARLASIASVTFQHPSHQIFASTVFKEAIFGPRALRRPSPAQLAVDALRLFSLETVANQHPYDLPLAGRKLLTLASAAATGAPLLAFDEPSVTLSFPEQNILARAITTLRGQGKTLLIVSHDLELFLPMATRVLLLREGALEFLGTPSALVEHQTLLRRTGMRLPLSFRLRPYVGLNPIPQDLSLPSPRHS